jgi:hypothetical protein
MKWILLLLLTACATPRQTVSLPAFPETHTDYRYLIRLPYNTESCVIRWYYLEERSTNMIYASSMIHPRTGVIETDMYFLHPGRYILTVHISTPDGSIKKRHYYNARPKFSQ